MLRILGFALLLAAAGSPAYAQLPAPFERVAEADLTRLLYPGSGTPPTLAQSAVWKEPGTPRLLALFAKGDGHYELTEVGAEGTHLVVTARVEEPERWDDAHRLDLAPYQVTRDRRAVGVRYQTMARGGTSVVLVLYLRAGATFERIFERSVQYQAMESDASSLADIQVLPGSGEYNDLRVVDRGSSGRTVRERWTWDAAKHVYREVRK
jgi:hypothetical protein